MSTIRIVIADDHKLFREGLHAILAKVPDIEVVGQAGTGQEAISVAQSSTPTVILMDINMPDMNGIEATQAILADNPQVGIIMLTMLEDNDSLFAAMCAGARGYILKGADKAEVIHSIRAIARGEALFGPEIATRLTSFFQNVRGTAHPQAEPFPDLTEREREVLDLIASGRNNQEIAHSLHISPKTVSNHISNIFNKLHVADRAQAIVKARQAGFGQDE